MFFHRFFCASGGPLFSSEFCSRHYRLWIFVTSQFLCFFSSFPAQLCTSKIGPLSSFHCVISTIGFLVWCRFFPFCSDAFSFHSSSLVCPFPLTLNLICSILSVTDLLFFQIAFIDVGWYARWLGAVAFTFRHCIFLYPLFCTFEARQPNITLSHSFLNFSSSQ